MRTLESVDPRNVVRILDRLTVLNLCKEAMNLGIELKAVPGDAGRCSTIVKQMIKKMRPAMECTVRSYATEKTRPYRLCIGKYQISMCPWFVQLSPIRVAAGKSITISAAMKSVVPTVLGADHVVRIIKGPIGEYARARGFTLAYRTAANTDVIVFAMASAPSKDGDIKSQVKIMKENMMSPTDFCRAVVLLYDELLGSYDLAVQAENTIRTEQAALKTLYNARMAELKKVAEAAEAAAPQAPAPVVEEPKTVEEEIFDVVQKERLAKRKLFEETLAGFIRQGGQI